MDSAGFKPTVLLYTVTVALTGGVMPNGVFFNRPGVALMRWDPASRAVCIEWQGWADPVEFAAALEAGLIALIENRGSRWLADCRDMKAIQQSDQEWLDSSWFPRMITAGLRRMAVVIPKSGLVLTNLEDIARKVPADKIDVQFFATVPEAESWISAPSTKTPPGLQAQPIS
jgi:stage II sporulation SpoAA-like protein